MKKFILTALTVLIYSFNASAVLIQPVRSNEVDDFTLSLKIASKSLKHKKAWAKLKYSQKKSALALKKSQVAPLALETDVQKRDIAAFERKVKEAAQVQAATGSNNTISSAQENSEQQPNRENSIPLPQNEEVALNSPLPEAIVNNPIENIGASQEQAALDPLPEPQAPEPPAPNIPEPPVVVNEHANEHANNNAQNNSSTESNSQNNSSNGSENSNAGGNKDKKK